MALKKFNSVEGFSVGSPGNVINVVDNFANVYANRIFVEQYANLGDVGNVYIGGGTNNQVLKTDGSGGLFWALDTAPAGGNTTEVQFNNSGSLDGSSAFTFDSISNALTISGNLTSANASLGNLVTANYVSANGSLLTNINSANIDGQVANALIASTVYSNAQPNITSLGTLVDVVIAGANSLTGANLISANYVAGTLTTHAQPNITSVGSLESLNVLGNITSANASLGNLATANYFQGNGSLLTGVIANANYAAYAGNITISSQPNITSVGDLTSLVVTGVANVVTGLRTANIQGPDGTVTIQTEYNTNPGDVGIHSNLTVGSSGTGNLTVNGISDLGPVSNVIILGGSPNYVLKTDGAGSLSWASPVDEVIAGSNTQVQFNDNGFFGADANFTFDKTTDTLTVKNLTLENTGNANLGNYTVSNYFQGDGSLLTNLNGANVSNVAYANYANFAGTVVIGGQPNITSLGTLVDANINGNVLIGGNLVVNGVTTYVNVNSLAIEDPIIEQGNGANNTPLTTNDGKDRGSVLHYYTTKPVDAFMGWDNSASEFAFGSNVSLSSEIATFNEYGNVRASYFLGNGSQLTGTIANANYASYAGNVINAVQGNITSVGTLSSLTVTGLVTATSGGIKVGNLQDTSGTNTIQLTNSDILVTGDITAGAGGTGNVTATYFIGDGSQLTGVLGSANYANYAGNVINASQPNITSVGTLANLAVTGTFTKDNKNVTTYTSSTTTPTNPTVGDQWYDQTNDITYQYIYDGASYYWVDISSGYIDSNVNAVASTLVLRDANANVYANYLVGSGLSVTGTANLGSISNVKITGGSDGYVIQTDGTGNLSFISAGSTGIAGSNTQVQFNDNGSFGATSGFAFDKTSNTLTLAGNVSASYFIGDGSQLTGLPASYSNANVASYFPTYTGNIGANYITATGNVSASYFIGNGSQLTGLPASYSNANVASYLPTYTGNFTAGNISVTGNTTSAYFVGNGSALTSITAGNVSGQVANALVAGTVYTGAQPNITSVGTLVDANISGNVLIGGNLIVNGTTTYVNVDSLKIEDPIIELGAGANGATLTSNDGKDRGTLLHYYTTQAVDAFMGWDNSNGEFAFGSNVTVSGEIVTYNSFGNVRANNFIGNLSQASGINASNIASGTVPSSILGNSTLYVGTTSIALNRSSGSQSLTGISIDGSANYATYAGTVTTNAQPNITSVGTLTSVSVTANVSAGNVLTNNLLYANGVAWNLGGTYSNSNVASYLPTYTGNVGANFITATGNVTAAYFIGNGSQLTGLPASYANANVAAYLPTYTGNIGANYITATGNVSATYFIGNGSQLTGLPASYANANVEAYLPTYTGLIGGTLTTQAQPNVTSLGTITDLDVSGNVTVDGTLYANTIVGPTSANVTITAGAFVSTFDEFGNITLSDNVSVVGNLSAANVKTDHLLYANGDPYVFTTSAAGSNTQIQFNDNSSFAGNANLTFDRATNTVTTDNLNLHANLTVNGLTDLGSVANITINGGAAGYVLTTDGSGSLTWSASGGSGGVSGFTSIVKDRFVTSGSSNTYTLSTTPGAKNDIEVIIDGLQQISNTYSLTGAVLSFPTNPAAGQIIEVTSFGTVDLTGNVGEIQFNNGGEFGSSPALTFNSGSNTVTTGNLTVTGNLTSQAGYVYLDNAIIAVSSGNAGIFNTGIGNINLGLAANVTLGSTSGTVTARGTFNSNNAIVNTIGVGNYYSTRDPINVTTDTIIDQFPVNDYRSAKYTMRVNSDDGYQAVEVLLVHNGSSSYVTIYGSISSSGSDIISLSSNIGSGNVRLFASTASTNTNVKILGTYVSD